MSFSQITDSIGFELSHAWEVVAAKVTGIDPASQHMVIVGTVIFIAFVAVVFGLTSLFQRKPDDQKHDALDEFTGSISILLRDLNTKINNAATQSREDFAYIKQEILEIKNAMSGTQHFQGMVDELMDMRHCVSHLPDLEQHVDTLSARIASYANLMREEFSTLREEMLNGKLVGKGTQNLNGSHVGSHVVDSADFFKQ